MALDWIQLVVMLAVGGAAIAAIGLMVAWRPLAGWLRTIAPRARFTLLLFAAALPLLAALGAVGVAFTPSVLDALGLVADHCGHHPGHDFHLCFVHGTPPAASAAGLAIAAVFMAWCGRIWAVEAGRLVRSWRWARTLRRVSTYDADRDRWTIDTGRVLAFSVGFFRPSVFLAEGVVSMLSESQLASVISHERAHVRRRDALTKSFARCVSALHLPGIRRRILSELDLAAEQVCDEAAVEEVGDRFAVAEAILAMKKAGGAEAVPAAVATFGGAAVEERVRALLDSDWRMAPWRALVGVTGAAVVGVGVHYAELHHDLETLLALLF